jgi:hypothetical protein
MYNHIGIDGKCLIKNNVHSILAYQNTLKDSKTTRLSLQKLPTNSYGLNGTSLFLI